MWTQFLFPRLWKGRIESGKMKVESGKFYKPKMIVVADTTPLISLLKM